MIQTDDDDLVLHRLFEPAPMPGGKDSISPQKIAEHDAETEHRKERRFFAANDTLIFIRSLPSSVSKQRHMWRP